MKISPIDALSPGEIYQAYMYSYPHKTAYGPLENINVFDYLGKCDDNSLSLYFHIPFCMSQCGYCNLFAISGHTESVLERYLDAMEQQITQFGLQNFAGRELNIGGGTPLVLTPVQLERLLAMLPDINKATSCIETSPNETTKEKLDILKMYGVDRVSMGVQSFSDHELYTLKRAHLVSSAYRALELLKAFEFTSLNLDLIYGIPGQTLSSFRASLYEAINFEPEEVFVYPLYIREGTSLSHKGCVNDDIYNMYWLAHDILQTEGYTQLSMRHFVKNPRNPGSCGFENMLAIGCGGRSYLDNLHFCHPYTLSQSTRHNTIENYIKAVDKTQVVHGYLLNQDERKRRFVIKNLLHVSGISQSEYRNSFLGNLCEDFPLLYEWEQMGYAQITDEHIGLTPLGLSFSDSLGPMLVSPIVRKRIGLYRGIQL